MTVGVDQHRVPDLSLGDNHGARFIQRLGTPDIFTRPPPLYREQER